MRGRKPKPTELHKRHGTVNVTKHKAQLAAEPLPVTEIGTPAPEWMTESQKASWDYAIANSPPALLKGCDRGTLVNFVCAEDRHRRAEIMQAKQDETAEFPMLMVTKQGNYIQSLYIGISNKAALLMLKAASELGFSPASRPRLAVATGMVMDAPTLGAPAPPSDNLDAFLSQRPNAIN